MYYFTTYLHFVLLDMKTYTIIFVQIKADGIWFIESVLGSNSKGYCVKRLHLCSPSECSLRDRICAAPKCQLLCPHMCLDTQLMFQSVCQGVRPGCVDQTGPPTMHSNKRD